MIVDALKNFDKYLNINPDFKKVSDFIKENNLLDMQTGRHEIDSDKIYVNIDEYSTKTDSIPEAHRNYIDIQIVLKGHEKIGYAPLKDALSTKVEYNPEKDIEFIKANCDFIKANPDKFFIFTPDDIHQPCITDGDVSEIKKAVFKVKILDR